MGEPFIGIDFGTSKCAMSWYDPKTNEAKIIRNAEGREETPSVVYLGQNDSEIVVGELAERKMVEEQIDQRYFVISVKRNLLAAPIKVLENGRVFTPVQVAEQIFRKLKDDAERGRFHQPVTRAVVTCPAAFDYQQRDKIQEAAKAAGFTRVEMLAEPIAAAIAYQHSGLPVGEYILVYDFGGGTLDVALLVCQADNTFEPALQPRGLSACGGDDLDRALYRYCEEISQQQLSRPISLIADIDLKFLHMCRERKEILSKAEQTTFSSYLRSADGPVYFEHTVNRAEFEARIKSYINNTVQLMRSMMDEARSHNYSIGTVVLIGGSSRVPMVTRLLRDDLLIETREFEQRDFAVALGAAYYAQSIWEPVTATTMSSDRPPPPPPTTAEEKYRQAVAYTWGLARGLTQSQVDTLNKQAREFGLSAEAAAVIEREIMGGTKEGVLKREQAAQAVAEYRMAVAKAWASRPLTQEKANELASSAAKLGLTPDVAAATERQIMAGHSKDGILYYQHQGMLAAYHSVVLQLVDKKALSAEQVNGLAALALKWGLSKDEAALIERKALRGSTKEDIAGLQHKSNLTQYANAVVAACKTGAITLPQLHQLAALSIKLGVSAQEAEQIEQQIMQKTKELLVSEGSIPPVAPLVPPVKK